MVTLVRKIYFRKNTQKIYKNTISFCISLTIVLLFSFICLFFASNAELLNASLGIFLRKSAICNSNFERLHGSTLFLFQFHFHLIHLFTFSAECLPYI